MVQKRSQQRAVLLALLLSTGTAHALASEPCMSRREKTAFEMRALQSQLMIAALKCDEQSNFNLFMQQHQPELNEAYTRIAAHFARVRGSNGEDERDSFITEMANEQEQAGLRHGSAFCANMHSFVLQSLALHDANELSFFVARTNVVNSYRLPVCVGEPGTVPTASPHYVMVQRPPKNVDARLHVLLDRLKAGQ